MIINAIGVWDISPKDVSDNLRAMNVSHTVFYKNRTPSPDKGRYNIVEVSLGQEQSVWPIVINGLRSYSLVKTLHKEYQRLILVCDSKPALKTTNLHLLDEVHTGKRARTRIKQFLSKSIETPSKEPFELVRTPEDIQALVDSTSKPSVLADIQTLIYKIHPYADQKVVRLATIMYITGKLSNARMRSILSRNLKSLPVIDLLESPKCTNLIDAVKQYSEGSPLDEVTTMYDIESFDVTYVVSSASKMNVRDLPS